MKKLAFVCMLLAVCNGIAAEGIGNDTVVVNNPRKVVVVTSDSLQQIKIEGADDNPNYKYENSILLVDVLHPILSSTTIRIKTVSTLSIMKKYHRIRFFLPLQ